MTRHQTIKTTTFSVCAVRYCSLLNTIDSSFMYLPSLSCFIRYNYWCAKMRRCIVCFQYRRLSDKISSQPLVQHRINTWFSEVEDSSEARTGYRESHRELLYKGMRIRIEMSSLNDSYCISLVTWKLARVPSTPEQAKWMWFQTCDFSYRMVTCSVGSNPFAYQAVTFRKSSCKLQVQRMRRFLSPC